ncbi:MAG: ABC transporter substrate-binding protein [Clostridia bacterium]|nr:ABC transporter substrate-binding protein [Clostridia bacterium]
MKRFISIFLCITLTALSAFSLFSCSKEKKNDGPVAYILAEKGNAYSLGLAESFKFAYEDKGGSPTMETFSSGTTDFSEYFNRAIEIGAKVIFLPNTIATAENLLNSAKKCGVNVPILAGDTWECESVLEAVKKTGLEVYFTTFFHESDTSTKVRDEFVTGFKKYLHDNSEYYEMNGANDRVTALSALGFDAYNTAMAAIRAAADEKGADLTSVDVATKLWDTEINGVCGKIVFDENGDPIKENVYIEKVNKDGSGFEFIKIQKVENNSEKGKSPEYDKMGFGIDKENKRITIGVFEPTTGDNAAGGKQELLGIMYANTLDKYITIGEDEYEVVLCVSDNGSLTEYAVTTATKLVEARSIIVIGSYGSSVSIEAAQTFEDAGIPAIGASCTSVDVTYTYEYYFRTTVSDSVEGEAMAEYAFELIK